MNFFIHSNIYSNISTKRDSTKCAMLSNCTFYLMLFEINFEYLREKEEVEQN